MGLGASSRTAVRVQKRTRAVRARTCPAGINVPPLSIAQSGFHFFREGGGV